MVVMIRRKKWNWIGHTLRKPPHDLAKVALGWNPQGRRKRDRPKETWSRTVRREAESGGKTWREVEALVQNRIRSNRKR